MRKAFGSVRVVKVNADSSVECQGDPLASIGLDNVPIVDSHGDVVGRLKGFYVLPGESYLDGMRRELPPSCKFLLDPQMERLLKQEKL